MTTQNDLASLRIDGDRLWSSLMTLTEIGATPKGGCRRLTLTGEDRRGRDLVIEWGKQAGLEVTVDQISNVFMRRAGLDPEKRRRSSLVAMSTPNPLAVNSMAPMAYWLRSR